MRLTLARLFKDAETLDQPAVADPESATVSVSAVKYLSLMSLSFIISSFSFDIP